MLFTISGSSARARTSPRSGNRCSRRSQWLQQTTNRSKTITRHRGSTTGTAMIALPRRSAPLRPRHKARNFSAVRSRRAYPPFAPEPTALATQGTHDCARDRPTRTAVPAASPQAPSHSHDDRQCARHSAIEQRDAPGERERERDTLDDSAEHEIFHERILLFVHARDRSRKNKTRQLRQKTETSATSTTCATDRTNNKRQLSQTDHESESRRAAAA